MDTLPAAPFRHDDPGLGFGRAELERMLEQGAIRRVLHGVYVRTDAEDSLELRCAALALVLPEDVVVVDRTAAWLYGIDVLSLVEHSTLPDIETASTNGRDRVRRQGVYGGKRDLVEDEICEVNGIRVTTPVRTACDLACLRGRSSALATLDAFAREFGLAQRDFSRQLVRFRRRRGVKQVRELVPHVSPKSESPGESWTRLAIIDAGFPAPEPQVWLLVPRHGWARLDLAYELLKIAVEYDGEEFHTSAADRAADDARRTALRRAGWKVIVVRKGDFTGPALDGWLAELREAVEERLPAYRRTYSRGETWDGWR